MIVPATTNSYIETRAVIHLFNQKYRTSPTNPNSEFSPYFKNIKDMLIVFATTIPFFVRNVAIRERTDGIQKNIELSIQKM